jgi:hypothetical protein
MGCLVLARYRRVDMRAGNLVMRVRLALVLTVVARVTGILRARPRADGESHRKNDRRHD